MARTVQQDHGLDEAREQIREVWETMAPGWEARRAYLAELSKDITSWLVDRLEPKPGQTILELAAGPGDTGFAAARRIGENGRLISTDLAPAMVEVARRRAAEVGVTNAEFRVLDAERNDLATDSVDGVLCRWGYSLVLDPLKALTETRRVLRRGGTHTLSVMASPQENPWGSLMMRSVVGLGLIPPPDPRHPGGLFSLADHDDLHKVIDEAGFSHIEIEDAAFRLRFTGFDDYWRFILEFAGGVSALLRSFPPDTLAKVCDATAAAIAEFRVGEGYEFPALTVNAAAR
ncbi:MAG: class I SAM-dependent methyltransferase [Actinomycetota bacterium]|nr:class I SAM-dependent methyltransferase [Actinomycetota bacterium]